MNLIHSNGKATSSAAVGADLHRYSKPDSMTELEARGKAFVTASGDLEAQPEDVDVLKSFAEARARESACPPFDPAQYPSDRLRAEECERLRADRIPLAHLNLHAEADLRKAEEELAATQSSLVRTDSPRGLMVSAAFVFAVTVAPTAHDCIFTTLPDELLNWFASLVTAVFVAAFIVVGILGDVDATRRAAAHRGLIAGILITVGLGILRVSQATSLGEVAFTGALTLVEVGVMALLEWRAAALRAAFETWSAQEDLRVAGTAKVEAARVAVASLKTQLGALDEAIASHIWYMEDRSLRHANVNNLAQAAIQNVVHGYQQGLADNRASARRTCSVISGCREHSLQGVAS